MTIPQTDALDIIFKLAAIAIAVVNVVLAIYVFTKNTEKTNSFKEQDRKINWLKTLVLDHNLKYLYDIIDEIESTLGGLKTPNQSIAEKQHLIGTTDDMFITLRRKFTDTLLAVDSDLYNDVLSKADDLQEKINTSAFNSGINLSHQPMFNQMILDPITSAKTEILRHLFNYKG